jgi:sulfite reductase alpha subunit-like flavoprotein
MAVSCDEWLTKLGARRLHLLGAANSENYTTEDDFIAWKDNLWSVLFEHFRKNEPNDAKPNLE